MANRSHLQLDERLKALRATDYLRNRNRLDTERVCILCEKMFTGRQVEIASDRSGSFHVHCPTETCDSGPDQWVYPDHPLVSEAAHRNWRRALGNSDSAPAAA